MTPATNRPRLRFGLRTLFAVVTVLCFSVALACGAGRLLHQASEREQLLAGRGHVYAVVPFDRPSPETGDFRRLGVTFGGSMEGDLTFEQSEFVRRIRAAFPAAKVRVMHDLRGPWRE